MKTSYKIIKHSSRIPASLQSIIDKLFNNELFRFDESDDFNMIIRRKEVKEFLFSISQELIKEIEPSGLQENLLSLLEEAKTAGHLTIPSEKLETIQNDITSREVADQIAYLNLEMRKIDHTYENMKTALKDSNHLVYYEYLYSSLVNKKADIDLREELNSIKEIQETLKKIVLISWDKKISEVPNVVKKVKQLKIVPPGILRAIPQGGSIMILYTILQRTEKVAEFFLKNLPKD
jgi:hypothetical protein